MANSNSEFQVKLNRTCSLSIKMVFIMYLQLAMSWFFSTFMQTGKFLLLFVIWINSDSNHSLTWFMCNSDGNWETKVFLLTSTFMLLYMWIKSIHTYLSIAIFVLRVSTLVWSYLSENRSYHEMCPDWKMICIEYVYLMLF